MDRRVRRLLSVDCGGAALGASLDDAAGSTGLLMVTGGTQTRIGSHRMYERLAKRLAEAGFPCLRYARRGAAASEGGGADCRASGPDIRAAGAASGREGRQIERLIGFGLCAAPS